MPLHTGQGVPWAWAFSRSPLSSTRVGKRPVPWQLVQVIVSRAKVCEIKLGVSALTLNSVPHTLQVVIQSFAAVAGVFLGTGRRGLHTGHSTSSSAILFTSIQAAPCGMNRNSEQERPAGKPPQRYHLIGNSRQPFVIIFAKSRLLRRCR